MVFPLIEMLTLVALAEVVEWMEVQDLVTVPLFLPLKVILVVQELTMDKVVAELQDQDQEQILLLVVQEAQALQLQLHHLQLHTQVAEVAAMVLVEHLVDLVVVVKAAATDLMQVMDLETQVAEVEAEAASILQVQVDID